jgi:hypothetical protein
MTTTPAGPQVLDAEGGSGPDAPAATEVEESPGDPGSSDLIPQAAPHHDAHAGPTGHPDPWLGEHPPTVVRPLALLVYSDDSGTRDRVRMAIGRRVAGDLPDVEWTECATPGAVLDQVDGGDLDVLILDGEATPAGGMGLCKQLKDEIYRCPPILVLTGRPQDAWLATWSRADAAVPHPLDPRAVADVVAGLARRRREG